MILIACKCVFISKLTTCDCLISFQCKTWVPHHVPQLDQSGVPHPECHVIWSKKANVLFSANICINQNWILKYMQNTRFRCIALIFSTRFSQNNGTLKKSRWYFFTWFLKRGLVHIHATGLFISVISQKLAGVKWRTLTVLIMRFSYHMSEIFDCPTTSAIPHLAHLP